jgi:hypothetical protein
MNLASAPNFFLRLGEANVEVKTSLAVGLDGSIAIGGRDPSRGIAAAELPGGSLSRPNSDSSGLSKPVVLLVMLQVACSRSSLSLSGGNGALEFVKVSSTSSLVSPIRSACVRRIRRSGLSISPNFSSASSTSWATIPWPFASHSDRLSRA